MIDVGVCLEWANRAGALLLWLLWWWWGRTSARPAKLWWSVGALALTTTLYVDPVAGALDRLTGVRWLSALLLHMAVVVVAASLVQVQTTMFGLHRRRSRGLHSTAVVVIAAGLVATWVVQPAAADAIGPDDVGLAAMERAAAGSTAHRALLAVVLLLVVVLTLRAAIVQRGDTPAGSAVHRAQSVVFTAALTVGGWSAVQLIGVARSAIGRPWPSPTMIAWVDLVATLLLELQIVAAILLGAARWAGVRRRNLQLDYRDVVGMREWLDSMLLAPAATYPRSFHGASMDVFGTVLEVRDRMCMAQQRVGKHDVLTAAELARRMGLRGGSARAFTVATLLEAACAAGATRRPLEPADLSKLGGGHSDEQELRWLADVNRARLAFPAADAAQLILERDEQLEHALSARSDPVWDGVSR